ncbi:von Willebrand factor type A [Corynebacterium suranareeae]|uniref:von Willebrand factor type A n=1 Tax=Corynebacterium suranareeae TaxID=2506452 RepID=A0A160PP43_9CORY|nr:VWA domain-containing protein [Corynebacterium suranareeae]BAU95757.1 von Willebrand factor type A [Corynebacterium suranareeae]
MKTFLKSLALGVSMVLLAGCSTVTLGAGSGSLGGGSSDPLKIVAATELEDLQPAIEQASNELGFDIELSFPGGTLSNSQALKDGEFDQDFDATWFATNRYVDLIGASAKLGETTKIATSPVAIAVKTDLAEDLGWDQRQPTWEELGEAAGDRNFTFGMTDPATSNSGFSALVAMATAYADTGQALNVNDIPAIAAPMSEFLSGQTITSGSSGWLKNTFLEQPDRVDAIINYESVLHTMITEDNADITVVVPADGVVSADYPLSTITGSDQGEQVAALAGWFAEHPETLTDAYRRPTTANAPLPAELSAQTIIEAPFPGSKSVTDALIDAYSNQFRVPGETTFVLDVSGSMQGERISLLKETMSDLITGDATTDLANVSLREREKVTIIPFSFTPHETINETLGHVDSPSRVDLAQQVDALQADGGTGIYDAVLAAYSQSVAVDYIPSIVLMTDGELTAGRTYPQFLEEWTALPNNIRSIPVFVILYGEANVADMEQLATTTGGKTFDALNGDLNEAFKEIRAYQ